MAAPSEDLRASVDEVDSSVPEPALNFDGFCRNEFDRLARALSLTLNNRDLGADAAAEGFTRAWQRWDTVSTFQNPAGWVYRVGLNWGRSRLRRKRPEVSVIVMPEHPHAAADFDDEIARALTTLSTDHRSVVVGKYYLDWSEAELATALDIPAGTVKSRLSRALTHLQHELGADHG
jgi:RNA polymerase sigma-70 factor (ECF subfamily)